MHCDGEHYRTTIIVTCQTHSFVAHRAFYWTCLGKDNFALRTSERSRVPLLLRSKHVVESAENAKLWIQISRFYCPRQPPAIFMDLKRGLCCCSAAVWCILRCCATILFAVWMLHRDKYILFCNLKAVLKSFKSPWIKNLEISYLSCMQLKRDTQYTIKR